MRQTKAQPAATAKTAERGTVKRLIAAMEVLMAADALVDQPVLTQRAA